MPYLNRIKMISFISSALMCVFPFVGGYYASASGAGDTVVSVSLPTQPKRGSILDRNGELIAYSEERKSICLVPSLFYSNEAVNSALSRLFVMSEKGGDRANTLLKNEDDIPESAAALMREATGLESNDNEELVKRLFDIFEINKKLPAAFDVMSARLSAHISADDAYLLFDEPSPELLRSAEIISQKEPFIVIRTDYTRTYAEYDGMTLCPHAVGFLSSGEGIESEYDRFLSGKRGNETGKYSLASGTIELISRDDTPPQSGADMTLTIDKDTQLLAQRLLTDAIDGGKCTAGAICVTDCKSGDILALASAPYFDPNTAVKEYEKLSSDASSPLFDRTLWGLYRPGSTMKTITAFAALDTGKIDGDTFLWCGRYFPLGDTTFSCLGYHGFEEVTGALRDSCNVFFYKCSQMLGVDSLSAYQSAFGLGKSVNVGLSNARGRVVTPESVGSLGIVWSDGLLVQSGIGQSENAVTPLQMAQWVQIIANKGELNSMGLNLDRERESTRLFSNDEAFALVHEGMIKAANNIWGEYSLSALPHQAAIKTGTPETGRGYNSAVIGFYPADDPQIAFSIMLEDSESAYTLVRGLLEGLTDVSSRTG